MQAAFVFSLDAARNQGLDLTRMQLEYVGTILHSAAINLHLQNIVPILKYFPELKYIKNSDGLTPRELVISNHTTSDGRIETEDFGNFRAILLLLS